MFSFLSLHLYNLLYFLIKSCFLSLFYFFLVHAYLFLAFTNRQFLKNDRERGELFDLTAVILKLKILEVGF